MSDSQPIFGPRQAVSLDGMLEKAGLSGWDWLEKLIDPSEGLKGELEESAQAVAPYLYGLALSPEGRAILEWLCDLTLRRRHDVPGASIESAALYAANRAGQDGVMHVILKAIRLGQQLVESKGGSARISERRKSTRKATKGAENAKSAGTTESTPRAGRRRRKR